MLIVKKISFHSWFVKAQKGSEEDTWVTLSKQMDHGNKGQL